MGLKRNSPSFISSTQQCCFSSLLRHSIKFVKMVTPVQKSFCVLQFARSDSIVAVQRAFRRQFGIDPPTNKSIRRWYAQFETTGCICKGKSPGRPRTANETIENVREAFIRSPRKSLRRASRELEMPRTTLWRILRRQLHMRPYRLQLVQSLKPADLVARTNFCVEMQRSLENYDDNFSRFVFCDEANFHTSGKVNKHNVRIWGTANPHAIIQHERDSPKVNVFCAMSKQQIYGPFFFNERTVSGISYLDMLENYLFPQLYESAPQDFIFQQDGAPPHFLNEVREWLNDVIPRRWIGRAGPVDMVYSRWPPRSPDLTPCDFFLWGYVKDRVYVPPLPVDLQDLRRRIVAAVESITPDMLTNIWEEFDYRLDVCRVTRGAHIEHL